MAKKTTGATKAVTVQDAIKALEDAQAKLKELAAGAIYPPRFIRASREIDHIKRRLAK